MTERISTRTLHDAIAANIASTYQRVLKLQQGMADGRAVRRPSDDPVSVYQAMRYREQLRANGQYERGLGGALAHLGATEATLAQIQDAILELSTLQVSGGDDSMGAEGRAALAKRVDQLMELLVELGNSRFAGVYLFGGTRSLEPPIRAARDEKGAATGVEYNPAGVDGEVRRQVSADVSLTIGVSAADLFDTDGGVFDRLAELRKALAENDGAAVRSLTGALEDAQERVAGAMSGVGTLIGRAESLLVRVRQDEVTYEAGRSRVEDLDVAKAAVDFQAEQVALQAALAAGSRILSLSLLDYLR